MQRARVLLRADIESANWVATCASFFLATLSCQPTSPFFSGLICLPFQPMLSDFEHDGFYQDDHGSVDHFPADTDLVAPSDDKSDLVGAQHIQPMSRHLRRARPPIDFSGWQSTVGSNSTTAFSHSRSYISGSTLHSNLKSGLKSSLASFLHKAPSLDLSPRIPAAVIALLTISDLYHNPHYRELRQKYDDLAAVLTAYMEQNLAGSRASGGTTRASSATTLGKTLVSEISQGVSYIPSGSHLFKSHGSITLWCGLWHIIVGAKRFRFTAADKSRLGHPCRTCPREPEGSAHAPTLPSKICPMGL
jgi:hypothetical protein